MFAIARVYSIMNATALQNGVGGGGGEIECGRVNAYIDYGLPSYIPTLNTIGEQPNIVFTYRLSMNV